MDSTTTVTKKPTTLRDQLESLPQELYDEIFSLVITASTSKTIVINAEYKYPKALELCREIRNTFATEYYTKNRFEGHHKTIDKWVSSLPAVHFQLDIDIEVWGYEAIKYEEDEDYD